MTCTGCQARIDLGDGLWLAPEGGVGVWAGPTGFSSTTPAPLPGPAPLAQPAAPTPGFWSSPTAGQTITAGAGLLSSLATTAGGIFGARTQQTIARQQNEAMQVSAAAQQRIAAMQAQSADKASWAQSLIAQAKSKQTMVIALGVAGIAAVALSVYFISRKKA